MLEWRFKLTLNPYLLEYINTNYNNNTTSQYGSCFRRVWGDSDIGNLTSTGISIGKEVEFRRPTKHDFVRTFYRRRNWWKQL